MSISKQLIDKFKELKLDNSISSYSHIKNILFNQHIPIPCTEIKPYKLIRYRRHNDFDQKQFFRTSEDLSYRKDIMNISNFGRANEPGQGLFYCNDNNNQDTGISEIVSVLRGNHDSKEEVLTIGGWNVLESLKLAMVLPIKDEVEEFYNLLPQNSELEDLKNLINYIAEEYSLDIDKNDSNYKITSAFSNYIKEVFPGLDGIIYSSIKSEHTGKNIVLWPETVDKKLEFVAARKSVFKRVSEKTFIEEQITESKSYNKINDEIVW